VHISEPLTIVHGQDTGDRWKIDRAVAGLDGMERWDQGKKRGRAHLVDTCRGCGNQYFDASVCCGRNTESVPLVHYMTVSSLPYYLPVEFSFVVFTNDELTQTRSLCTDLLKEFDFCSSEIIFVHCHPRRPMLDYFRKLAKVIRVKAVFAPRDQPFIYGHDVNRAARAADGRYLIFLDRKMRIESGTFGSSLQDGFSGQPADILNGAQTDAEVRGKGRAKHTSTHPPINHSCWAVRQDRFWQLGAIAERFEEKEAALSHLQRRVKNRALRNAFAEWANRSAAIKGTSRA